MNVRVGGDGPAVLFLHGMAGSSRTWREVLPTIAKTHKVIAPDLVGHGESAKPMGDYSLGAYASGLRDLLGILDVPRVTVVGQSLGGGVALQLAYQHPELVDRLVLVAAGGLGREVSWLLRMLTLPGAELTMPLLFPSVARDVGNRIWDIMRRLGLANPHAEEMWMAYESLTGVENRQAFLKTLRSVVEPGGQSVSALDRLYLAALMPTMIVWGDDDPIIPVDHGYRAHELIPGSRLEIIEGVGHFPHVECPEKFCELLLDFLATSEASSFEPSDYRALLASAGS